MIVITRIADNYSTISRESLDERQIFSKMI
jgi:hypothetical protein